MAYYIEAYTMMYGQECLGKFDTETEAYLALAEMFDRPVMTESADHYSEYHPPNGQKWFRSKGKSTEGLVEFVQIVRAP